LWDWQWIHLSFLRLVAASSLRTPALRRDKQDDFCIASVLELAIIELCERAQQLGIG
jgi:hypothetical protein